MVAEARKRNISVEHLLEKAVRFKRKMLKEQHELIRWCSGSEIKEHSKLDVIGAYLQEIEIVGSVQINRYYFKVFSSKCIHCDFFPLNFLSMISGRLVTKIFNLD